MEAKDQEVVEIPMEYFIDWLWMQDSKTQEMWDVDPDGLMQKFLNDTDNGRKDLYEKS